MKKTRYLTTAAIIAAIYIILTLITNALGLANGAIQVRFSESLCVLPMFTPAAIPGLFIGCFLSNIFTGCVFWDVDLRLHLNRRNADAQQRDGSEHYCQRQ